MEFPHLGQHCSESQCRRLDFLPVKCDGCSKVFCNDHYSYGSHNCPVAYQKNVQVPVCPLCNALIPGKADELPDIRVSRHIDSDCRSDTAVSRRTKVYNNRCSRKGYKQKELVPVLCDRCNQNYCLKHRHPIDHSCTNAPVKGVSKAGVAALSRIGSTNSNRGDQPTRSAVSTGANPRSLLSSFTISRTENRPENSGRSVSALQGNLTEEDALRMALEASLSTEANTGSTFTSNPTALSQEQEDFMLAKALAESEMAAAGVEPNSSSRRSQQNCAIC